jgi:hypothetical protein
MHRSMNERWAFATTVEPISIVAASASVIMKAKILGHQDGG